MTRADLLFTLHQVSMCQDWSTRKCRVDCSCRLIQSVIAELETMTLIAPEPADTASAQSHRPTLIRNLPAGGLPGTIGGH